MATWATVIKTELTTDPLARGYAGMTDQEVADSLNTVDRERNKTTLSGTDVFNAINVTEFNALTDAVQARIWNVLHLGTINPFGLEATLFVGAFGAESETITNLSAIRKESISRATEIGVGFVMAGHVQNARM